MAAPAKEMLRFIACGSVDAGKSTLIERLLLDCKTMSGLHAEREQGIPIGVAYRHFETASRKFIVADTPSHEQNTRHMVAGASTADLAMLVVDASQDLELQTSRLTLLSSLLGIRHVVLAINKMDLAGHCEVTFERIAGEYREFAASLGIARVDAVPVVAVHGDNLTQPSATMPWYRGATLLDLLEAAPIEAHHPMTLTPADNVAALRGDMIVEAGNPAKVADRVEAPVVRLRTQPWLPGRTYATHNVHWQAHEVKRATRALQKGQRACVVWFTGLSGAGKSTIADLVERRLFALGHHTYLLDGDNVRHGLNKDLGFTDADRVENIRRITEVAALMADAGLIVLAAFISPFRSERDAARRLLGGEGFIEVHVDAPLALAEQRDPKGLYRKARRGELHNFTGIDSPYEAPEQPELHLDTSALTADACADAVLTQLRERGFLRAGG